MATRENKFFANVQKNIKFVNFLVKMHRKNIYLKYYLK